MLLSSCRTILAAPKGQLRRRLVSTLSTNKHIYVHSNSPSSHTLSFLPTSPPSGRIAIGTTTSLPPTPESLQENHNFLTILQSVIREHATQDPDVISQAQAYASSAGSSLGSGGVFFPSNHPSQRRERTRKQHTSGSSISGGGGAGGDGAGGASSQGGAGGGGRGGYIHVSDQRNPPDYGRTAWPEDIFGSLEVDHEGNFVRDANKGYQESGTYRMITREGILGLSPYLRERLIERLKQLEKEARR